MWLRDGGRMPMAISRCQCCSTAGRCMNVCIHVHIDMSNGTLTIQEIETVQGVHKQQAATYWRGAAKHIKEAASSNCGYDCVRKSLVVMAGCCTGAGHPAQAQCSASCTSHTNGMQATSSVSAHRSEHEQPKFTHVHSFWETVSGLLRQATY